MGRARQVGIELTPRQREVIELLAKGHTNGEIAERLGITLPGAKWHVRELMDRVGVESRDELAEWWERERSVGVRASRALRSLWAGLGLARIAAGAAVVAVGLVGTGVLIDFGGRGSPTPAAIQATATPSATPTRTPVPRPAMSRDEAVARARELLGPQLRERGLDFEYEVNGEPLASGHFEVVEAEFVADAEQVLVPGAPNPFPITPITRGPRDVWRLVLAVTGIDEPATEGSLYGFVLLDDRTGDPLNLMLLGSLDGLEQTRLNEEALVATEESALGTHEVVVFKTIEGWTYLDGLAGRPETRGGSGTIFSLRGPRAGQVMYLAPPQQGGSGLEIVAFVGPGVDHLRITLGDGTVVVGEPQPRPAGSEFPWRAVRESIVTSSKSVEVEAMGADGRGLAYSRRDLSYTAGAALIR
jgi:DNA-binding CsgD family transcriptional regulator